MDLFYDQQYADLMFQRDYPAYEHYDALFEKIHETNQYVVLTADVGRGKTHFLTAFMEDSKKRNLKTLYLNGRNGYYESIQSSIAEELKNNPDFISAFDYFILDECMLFVQDRSSSELLKELVQHIHDSGAKTKFIFSSNWPAKKWISGTPCEIVNRGALEFSFWDQTPLDYNIFSVALLRETLEGENNGSFKRL